MEIYYVVRFLKVFRIMYTEIIYLRQLTFMSTRKHTGSLYIYTNFVIAYND